MKSRAFSSICALRDAAHILNVRLMERIVVEPQTSTSDSLTSFVCPCDWNGLLSDTYASVLVLGVDAVQSTLDEIIASSTGSVANTSSYCLKCRRITPSLNTALSIQENVMNWKKQHTYFGACSKFIGAWPKQTRGMRLRNRRKKQMPVEDG